MQPSARLLALLMMLLALPTCRTVEQDVTGVRLVVSWTGRTIDQLAIELYDAGGQMLGPRELRPRTPDGPLEPGTDLLIYLPDERGGQPLRARVQGLLAGGVVASTEGQVTLTAAEVVPLTLTLPGGNSGADAGADAPGGSDGGPAPTLVNGQPCTAASACKSGNCTDGVCCESPGCGPCRSCAIAGMLGGCRNVPEGTVCEPTRCHSSGEAFLRPDLCDALGVCVNKGTQSCAGYKCNPAASMCYGSCTDDSQCAAGVTCRSGRCE